MRRHLVLLLLLSVLVVAATAYNAAGFFFNARLPMNVALVDAHTAVITPLASVPLPAPIKSGDTIEIPALDTEALAALAIHTSARTLPLGKTYVFAVRTDAGLVKVPVTTIDAPHTTEFLVLECITIFVSLLLGVMSLLLIWFGRDRAAWGMALWSMGYIFGLTLNALHIDGWLGISFVSASILFFIVARIGLYMTADTLVAASLTRHIRAAFRTVFILVLLVASLQPLCGLLALPLMGSAEFLLARYTLLFSWVYLIPIAMLFVGSRHVDAEQRVRLRWISWSAAWILISITLTNMFPIGFIAVTLFNYITFGLACIGFIYSLLKHRVIALSFVMDRALVYGGVTTLVVGVIAAMNSLALRATLGAGTSLLLQIVVPLALGIVLGKLRVYMDRFVERVFFRSKYLAEKALKSFARRCGHIEDVQRLLDAAVDEIRRHTQSSTVALYEITDKGYKRVRQTGAARYPARLGKDDAALVALRAERKSVELSDIKSSLGTDGCVFPIAVLGRLRGVLVCANRPGEHYASDEKKLLTQVIRDVGAAWRILRARDNEQLVWALAQGTLKPAVARSRAKAITAAWAGAPVDA